MFHHKTNEKNMMKGSTPFCQLEEQINNATHQLFNNLTKKDTAGQFLANKRYTIICQDHYNTYTLAWTLFTSASHLTIGLK